MSDDLKTETIRRLNDTFRRTFAGGKVVMTHGVNLLDPEEKVAIMRKVRLFDDFKEVNDPYNEHDFGAFEHDGEKFFWKIDYYDKSLENGSEDPSNRKITERVMTVMFANEY